MADPKLGATPGLTLRRWQTEAIPLALDALEARRSGVVVATTGAGKSIFLAALLDQWRAAHPQASDETIVVTTPTRKLVEQLSDTLTENLGGVSEVGRYYTRAKQHARPIVVCCNPSVPMLAQQLQEAGKRVSIWIADEAHRTESDGMKGASDDEGSEEGGQRIAAALDADRRIGLTATPFRSDADERISLFDSVIYRYSPADALRDGVIVPWRIVGWGEEREDTPVDEAVLAMIRELGDRATRGPGVVNATSIEDAEGYVAYLGARGIVARPIHSRLTRGVQEQAIAELRDGALDCLVHVSMLVEGVDFPWLRWLGLRRPVGARVRFIQEVGRVLRSYPGKSEAVLLDPHDLFGAFHLSYSEALGWAEPEEESAEDMEAREEREDCDAEDKEPDVVRAARTGALGRYVRQIYLALVAEGIATEDAPARGSAWRGEAPSERQISALAKMGGIARRLASEHEAVVRRIAETPAIVTRGIASDLMSLLVGLRNRGSGTRWTPASPVRLPPESALQGVAVPVDTRVYAAGVMRAGVSAVAITRGSEVLYVGARPSTPRDRWGTLTARGVELARERYGAADVVTDGERNPAARVAWAEVARYVREHREGAA